MTLARQLAEWVARLRYDDLPRDVVDATILSLLHQELDSADAIDEVGTVSLSWKA